jgi:SAM-dependent methyltransferase
MNNFNLYSNYYDLFNSDKDYKSEIDYIQNVISQNISDEHLNILELGSGSGGHAEFLARIENVNSILGVEKSSTMVDIANDKNIPKFKSIIGDITKLEYVINEEKFNVALSLFHVISYLNNNDDLISCFEGVHNSLKYDGLFIFDVWYSPAVYIQKPETRIRKKGNDEITAIRIAQSIIQPDVNVVDVNFEIIVTEKASSTSTSFNETHCMRHFSTPEIKLIARFTGFEIVDVHEFLTLNRPSESTWGVTYVLRKK